MAKDSDKPTLRRVKARSNGKRGGGRPRWEPTTQDRLMVKLAIAGGMTQEQTAQLLGISVASLQRHCRSELDTAALDANAKVSGALFSKAMKGDIAAIIWWEKTRRGLKDMSRTEHTGKDGGPIEYQNLSDEEIDARITAMIAGDGPGITTH